ncbi:MetQ/NlpA family ABC transporter substrate-binding protein [Propionispira raffinosivorans]|uniref:MetQ/NlpA family ABC transporter substrate-binding protein n=1 Tax=Propionispira raffinosivorans TaxID=86959 RepID=UPI0003629185|nr:MetQ/NlpA family ABC transporter substrate-binding protein [Propionispira raffinosivorans]
MLGKKIVKNVLLLVSILLVGILFSGCGADKAVTAPTADKSEVTLKVGAALIPHTDILNFIKPKLKEAGINLEIVNLDDEGQLNPALQEKQIDANYFQHVPYLDSVAKEKGYDFVSVAKVHVEPMGFYSQKIKSIDALPDGAKIAIPNNPSNEFRSLVLLQKQGLIKLKADVINFSATPKDIVENPKHLQFVEVESAQLVRALPDVDGAVINTNWILEAKIDPNSALFREAADSPYANVLVVRKNDENRPEIQKLVQILQSDDVRKFIEDKYKGAVVPAF